MELTKIIYLTKEKINLDNNFFFRFEKKSFKEYIPFSYIYKNNGKYFLFSGFSNFNSIKDNKKYPFAIAKDSLENLFLEHIKLNILHNTINIAQAVNIYNLYKNHFAKSYNNKKSFEDKIHIFSILKPIINKNKLTFYYENLEINELKYFSHLNLRKKEIDYYIKFKNLLSFNNKLLNNFLLICTELNFNRNLFYNFLEKIYEIIYINKNDNIADALLDKINDIIKNFKQDMPIHHKQKFIFNYVDSILLQPYFDKENSIKNYIKNLNLKNAQFEFTPYFEEKDFILKFNIKRPDDIEHCFKDFDVLKKHLKELWEII